MFVSFFPRNLIGQSNTEFAFITIQVASHPYQESGGIFWQIGARIETTSEHCRDFRSNYRDAFIPVASCSG
jgi:hypothetical protein